jgi:uroporphyrinogen decarboxylase
VVGLSYLVVDDEALMDEIVETFGNLYYQIVEYSLVYGAKFDFGHFWEDICYKAGPLVSPAFFRRKIGPQYRRICDLLLKYGLDIVSLDCDGKIDALVPIWLENGVNTMFPIEVGVWDGNIKPWREKYGKQVRGVGGMDKKVFAYDYKAIDQEIERLKGLVELGGFIPCPDHRIAPDAKWENVQYYCEKMRKVFS